MDIGTVTQLEECQGHIVEARMCERKDMLRLFLKVQSVAMFMVRIYYPFEGIFLATVCLTYLSLYIWELLRKNIGGQKRKEITCFNNSDEKNKC